ncbi:MAG: site-specific integrase, partial [Planctomycetota bacterium]
DEVSIMDVLVDHVIRKRGVRPKASPERTALEQFTAFFERHRIVTVSDFTLESQERYAEERREAVIQAKGSCSNATVNRDLEVMRAALNEAWKRGRLDRKVHVTMLKKPPPRDRFLRVEEAQRLLAECREPHLRRFVLLMLHTVQRPGAIFDLRVEQVDLDAGRINFLPTGRDQSSKRRPVVPITRSLRPELEAAIAESCTGHILEYNELPLRSVRTAFTKACQRAGLDRVSPYVLRHTGATLMAARGVPMRQIAGFLGHTTERTTEIYSKHHPDFLQEAASTLDELFGDLETPKIEEPPKLLPAPLPMLPGPSTAA